MAFAQTATGNAAPITAATGGERDEAQQVVHEESRWWPCATLRRPVRRVISNTRYVHSFIIQERPQTYREVPSGLEPKPRTGNGR